jgi:hypothetical protein
MVDLDVSENPITDGPGVGDVVPHYGHGHEDKDTEEHMNAAFVPDQTAATVNDLATGVIQAPHYGKR